MVIVRHPALQVAFLVVVCALMSLAVIPAHNVVVEILRSQLVLLSASFPVQGAYTVSVFVTAGPVAVLMPVSLVLVSYIAVVETRLIVVV